MVKRLADRADNFIIVRAPLFALHNAAFPPCQFIAARKSTRDFSLGNRRGPLRIADNIRQRPLQITKRFSVINVGAHRCVDPVSSRLLDALDKIASMLHCPFACIGINACLVHVKAEHLEQVITTTRHTF